jgi:ribonuclease E
VTSTRRRSARRPAGPPAAVGGSSTELGAGRQSPPSAEPVEVPVEPAVAGQGPTDPTATEEPVATPDPRADDADEGAAHADTWPDAASDPDQDAGDDDETSGFSLRHVPIKRKGSRKR